MSKPQDSLSWMEKGIKNEEGLEKNATDSTLMIIAPKARATSRKHFNGSQMWVNADMWRYYPTCDSVSIGLLFRSRNLNSFDQYNLWESGTNRKGCRNKWKLLSYWFYKNNWLHLSTLIYIYIYIYIYMCVCMYLYVCCCIRSNNRMLRLN